MTELAIPIGPSRFCSCRALLILALTGQVGAFAVDAHPLELRDIPNLVGTSELLQASDVAISPDGNWVAYTVTSQSLTTMQTKQRLFVQRFEGAEATQIGLADADNSGPVWAPDGSKLLFYTSSSGRNSVAIWTVADKQTRVMTVSTRLPAQWLPDSNRFVVGVGDEEHEPGQASDGKKATPVVFTSSDTNRRLPSGHYLALFPRSVWRARSLNFAVVDAASGAAKTVVSNVDTGLVRYQLSPDGSRLVYTVSKGEFDYDTNLRRLFDIKVAALQTGSTTVVASDVLGRTFAPVWSHNGKMLAVIGGTVRDDEDRISTGSREFERPGHCYVIDLDHPGILHAVGPRSFSRYFDPTWASDDSAIYLVRSRNDVDTPEKIVKVTVATGATETAVSLPPNTLEFEISGRAEDTLYIKDLNKGGENMQVLAFNLHSHQLRPMFHIKQAINSLSVSKTGVRLAYLSNDSSHFGNVRVADGRGESRQLTQFELSKEQQQKLGKTVGISWQYEGETRYGTVWLPASYREGQRYPTIVEVYPGNQGSGVRDLFRGDVFDDALIWQAFSASGYVYFWPDFTLHVGEGPHEIAAQIIPALDKLVALGIADPDGFGVYGRSWGGYSTYSLITETQRFKAAIPAVGYANLLTEYGALEDDSSAYNLGLTENNFLGASPWQNRDLYIKNSPYFNFDKVTTPVLIQYGEKDRAFAWTSKEAFVALRRLGKTATLLGYPDEGHGVSKPENRVDFTNRALEFFDRYLKPKDHAASAARHTAEPYNATAD